MINHLKMDNHWIFLLLLVLTDVGHTSTTVRVRPSIAMTRNIDEENGPPILSESIQGSAGRLPCNVTPPIAEDRVALVIWYKVGSKTPIYSVDTRDSDFSQGTHWSDDAYGERLSFTVVGRSGTLKIKSTRQEDTGEYRCRVDFQKSPTRNSKVNLTVITPPENLVILDSKGGHIPHYILGPYNEGAVINISCVSTGGRPQPKVTWWHENTLLDNTSHPLSDRRVGNVLSLGKLKRRNLNMQLTCQASNNNLTTPISSTVTLDMNLRPLAVKLQGENRPLSADNSYQLSCMVIGSRPAPTITWWKGSTPMKNTHEISNPDGNMTTSILTFTPTIDDRGKFLSCRAEQSMIPESGMEDGWKLDIYHIPVVSLELGTNSMNASFREGIDVFFECNIKSNPWIYKVSWRHNGNSLENNLAEGIIVANQSLVLQNVSRARSGIYTCVGSNREGDGESNPVHLDIRFAPICRPGQKTVYSSGRHETIKIACEVEANPTELSYIWKFNATLAESIDIPASLVAIDRGRSIAHYTPMTENDYGTLMCWANNEIGDQSEPCIYTINPAGEPDPLINCTLLNQTSTGFQIECLEGFDGGLQQDFIMEVYVNGTTRHPKIYKSKTPYFEVRGLVPGAGYNVFLVAHNSKGRSNATILQVYTLKDPEKQTVVITFKKDGQHVVINAAGDKDRNDDGRDKNLSLAYAPVIEDIRPFLGILVGIVGGIFLVALIIVVIVRMRGSSGRDRNNYSHQVSSSRASNGGGVGGGGGGGGGGMLHNGQSVQDIRIGRETCHVTSSVDSIDKNPDIIPQDGREDDDEWTTKGHSRAYATAALAEQNAVITSSTYDRIPTYAVIDKKTQNHIQQQLQHQHNQHQIHAQHQQQQQQLQHHQMHHHHGQYIQYNTLIPVSKMGGYAQQQQQQQQQMQHQQHQQQQQLLSSQNQLQHQANKTDLTYADLVVSGGGQRMTPYCSATLGRPRQSDMKRAEPNIYSQIDLAHHPMYSTSPMFGTNTITGVTMSHPSQLATFTPSPPIFAHKTIVSAATVASASSTASAAAGTKIITAAGGGGGGGVNNIGIMGNGMLQSPISSGGVSSGSGNVGVPTSIVCIPTGVSGILGGIHHSSVMPHSSVLPPSASTLKICTTAQQSPSSGGGKGTTISSNGLHSKAGAVGIGGSCASGGGGSIIGVACYGETNSNQNILKTVPEEIHRQMSMENVAITKDRNYATRF